jgi:catechol 2,3-dioxygenase-like lactoylglutathione lyase family enzyme
MLESPSDPEESRMLQKHPFYAYIPAKDVARARRFYEDKVGLRPGAELEGGVTYEFGGHTACFLYDAGDSAGTSKASQAFWQVDDVEREVQELRARGVTFERYDADEIPGMAMRGDIAEGGGTKAAWFKDTEGNIMALIQDTPDKV